MLSESADLVEDLTTHLAQTCIPEDATSAMQPTAFDTEQPVLYDPSGCYNQQMGYYMTNVAPYNVASSVGGSYYGYGNRPPDPVPFYNSSDNAPATSLNGINFYPNPYPFSPINDPALTSGPAFGAQCTANGLHACRCMYCNYQLEQTRPHAAQPLLPLAARRRNTIPPFQNTANFIQIASDPTAEMKAVLATSSATPMIHISAPLPRTSHFNNGGSGSILKDPRIEGDPKFDRLGKSSTVPFPFDSDSFALDGVSSPLDGDDYTNGSGGSVTPIASPANRSLKFTATAPNDPNRLFSSTAIQRNPIRSILDSQNHASSSAATSSSSIGDFQRRRHSYPLESTVATASNALAARGRKRKTQKLGEVSEEWVSIEDGRERRKAQNKLAQRAFRARRKMRGEPSDPEGVSEGPD